MKAGVAIGAAIMPARTAATVAPRPGHTGNAWLTIVVRTKHLINRALLSIFRPFGQPMAAAKTAGRLRKTCSRPGSAMEPLGPPPIFPIYFRKRRLLAHRSKQNQPRFLRMPANAPSHALTSNALKTSKTLRYPATPAVNPSAPLLRPWHPAFLKSNSPMTKARHTLSWPFRNINCWCCITSPSRPPDQDQPSTRVIRQRAVRCASVNPSRYRVGYLDTSVWLAD